MPLASADSSPRGISPSPSPRGKILPAILCGNTVVIKPAEDTPLSVYRFVKAFEEAGLPPGVVNLVTGYGETAGAPLVTHPTIRLVSFTGSTQVGRLIATGRRQGQEVQP